MNVFENYKNLKGIHQTVIKGKKIGLLYNNLKQFATVYHITHLSASKYLLESQRIIPQLIQDKSKLNTERIKVIWLSPNEWYQGSLYGNIRFSYNFNNLIKNKKFYSVEVMSDYNPHACRILISSEEYNQHPLLSPYNPYNKYDGPWHIDSNGINFYHGDYNIEFMFDDELDIKEATMIDFVKHHPDYCNIFDNGTCKDLSKSSELSEINFVSYLIANSIKLDNLNLQLSKDESSWSLLHIATVLERILCRLTSKEIFEGTSSLSIDTRRQLAKSILELISKEDYSSAIILSKSLDSKNTLDETIRELFAIYFEVPSSDLFISKILE